VQPNRLVDGEQFVKAILPRRADTQTDIDLCE
jgi:hypothetical protein